MCRMTPDFSFLVIFTPVASPEQNGAGLCSLSQGSPALGKKCQQFGFPMSSQYNISWDGTLVKSRCCWVLVEYFVGFCFVLFLNYKRTLMVLLPELGGGEESLKESVLSCKLLSTSSTVSAGGPQCCHTPMLIWFCWKQKVVHSSPFVKQVVYLDFCGQRSRFPPRSAQCVGFPAGCSCQPPSLPHLLSSRHLHAS